MSLVVTASAAVATICLVLSSVSSNWRLGPQSVAVIAPWNWKASLLSSTLFWRTAILPLTASTRTVYAVAAPPSTSTTLASNTGRTVPSAYARDRSRTCCCWAKPGTLKRVQPSESVTFDSEPSETLRPMLAAAFTHAAVGDRLADGTEVALVLTSEEETYWTAPLPTPTVTMLSRAGAGPPKSWRKSTARAVLPASFWSLTRVRPFIWAAESPNTEAWATSHDLAAVAASLEVAAPREPATGEMDEGVPKVFQ